MFLRNFTSKVTNKVWSNNLQFIRLYDTKIINAFESPKNVGSFDKKDKTVGTALVGSPACGDVVKLQIKVNQETNVIEDSCFKAFGCGSAIASTSYSTEYIKNKTLEEAEKVTNKEIAKELNLPPVKLHCSMLAEDAIKMAVNDYNNKQNN